MQNLRENIVYAEISFNFKETVSMRLLCILKQLKIFDGQGFWVRHKKEDL